jgi:uncharacterized Zn finger protein
MFTSVSVTGYAPSRLYYCPECGSEGFPHTTYHSDGRIAYHSDGRMECKDCGLVCYIVEADESHRDEEGAQGNA